VNGGGDKDDTDETDFHGCWVFGSIFFEENVETAANAEGAAWSLNGGELLLNARA
jgi:hypothetical protein